MPLTDTAIRMAKAADKVQRIFDGGGLYLEISPAGSRWWRLKYRFDGKEKRGAGHLSGYQPCERARQARRSPQAAGGRRRPWRTPPTR